METLLNDNNYKAQLLLGFPSSLHQEVASVISIIPFKRTVHFDNREKEDLLFLISDTREDIFLDGESIIIPGRIYFEEPETEKEAKLSSIQKDILNCIYLRHDNGFIRQRRLQHLNKSNCYFIIPYKVQLLGEYVIEILEVLDDQIQGEDIDKYFKFINENRSYWHKTKSRIISYWNEYYRGPKIPTIDNYIGKQIFDRINNYIPAIY